MSGLILLAVLGIWGWTCFSITKLFTRTIEKSTIKKIVSVILFSLFFLAPVADDIAGGFQFRELCKKKAVLVVDEEKIKGRTVISIGGKNSQLAGYILPTRMQHWAYKDKETGEILISWNDFYTKGGWLSRAVGFPEGSPPYTFSGSCLAEGGLDYIYNNNSFKIEIRK